MANRSLKKNTILNTIKQLCSMLFPLISFSYTVRVLGVGNYGRVNFSASIVTYFTLLAALGIQNYGVREGARIREDKEKISLFANQLFTVNFITSLVSVILLCGLVFSWGRMRENWQLVMIQSLVIPFAWLGCEWINVVYEDYTYITIRYIGLQLLAIVLLLLFVKKEEDYVVYAAVTTLAQAGAGLLNVFYIRKKYLHVRLLSSNICFRAHIRPLLILFAVALSSYIYINSDTTMIGLYRSEEEVGLYSAATKIYSMIKMLLNATVVASIPRISVYLGENKRSEYNSLIHSLVSNVALLVLPCGIGLFLLAGPTLLIASGSEYVSAFRALRYLAISLLFAPFSYIYSSGILVANKKENTFLYATIIGASVNVLLNMIIIPRIGYVGAAITTLISEVLVFLITFISARNYYCAGNDKSWKMDAVFGCAGIVVVYLLAASVISDPVIMALITVLVSIPVYAGILLIRKNEFMLKVVSHLKHMLRIT